MVVKMEGPNATPSARSQTFPNVQAPATSTHGNETRTDVQQNAKILFLARSVDIDIATGQQGAPGAYRVLELMGTETYAEVIVLLGVRLGFYKEMSRSISSIQIHDESEITQILFDNQTALEYFIGQLKCGVGLRMTIYAEHDNLDGAARNIPEGAATAVELTDNYYDRATTPVYSEHHRSHEQENNSHDADFYHHETTSIKDEGQDTFASDLMDTDQEYRRPITPDPETYSRNDQHPAATTRQRPRSRSASPQNRGCAPYRLRDYDLEGKLRRVNENGKSRAGREWRESPDSVMSPSSSYPSTHRHAATVYDLSGVNLDVEDGETAGTTRASSLARRTRHRGPQDKRALTKRVPHRVPGFGRDNNIPDRERPSEKPKTGPEPWWMKERFCDVRMSDVGKEVWKHYNGDHLKIRVSTSCAFQSTWDNVLDELFHRDLSFEYRSRNVPRKPGFVLMLFMRINQRPKPGAAYEADGDVGVMINGKNIVPGTLKWNWEMEALFLRFRVNGAARVIHRQTRNDYKQDVGTPEANGDCNVAVNFHICPNNRKDGKTWEAIEAVWKQLGLGKETEFIVRCSRSQLAQDAWDTISTYEGAEYAPMSEFRVHTNDSR
ncbi:hypothetical protein ABW21_db0202729 [Orbilia brochopaga]|nr:hypothetical protein ABW21_db0202729 [Drechslerella brochopaga]